MRRRVRWLFLVMPAVVAAASAGGLSSSVAVASAASVYSNGCSSLGWPALCTSGEFVEPIGVAVDNSAGASNGDVYVVVYKPTPEVLQFKANGERTALGPVRGPAGRELQLPLWAAVDSSTGDLYVSDFVGGVLDKFKPNGELEEAFGTNGQLTGFQSTAGVAVQQSTGDVFVASRGSEEVFQYSSAGALLGRFRAALNPLDGVAVDSAGDVWVQQDPEGGGQVKEYPVGKRTEPVTLVAGGGDAVAVDQSTGKVFVTRNGGQEVAELEPNGTLVEPFAAGELGAAGSFGIGVNETTHSVYASNRSEGLGGVYTLGPPRFALTVEKTGTGTGAVASTPVGVACGAHCAGRFEEGQTVKLKATAGAASLFAGWEGCDAEPGGECEVTITAARAVKAVFNEAPSAPLIEAEGATSVAQTTATLTGSVNPKNETPTACQFHYALEEAVLATTPSSAECEPEAAQLGSANTPVPVTAKLKGLQANTLYYYQLTASNHIGTANGTIEHLLTLPNPPTASTGEASELTPYTAVINATVNPGAAGHAAQDDTTYRFQYSTDETFSTETPVLDAGEGTTPVPVHARLESLQPGTIYHYRILATNNNTGTPQTTISPAATFTTIPTPPALTGAGAGAITAGSALITATLQTQGLPTRWELQLATNPTALQPQAAGNTTSPEGEPIGAQLENLQPNTTYYYRLTAENPDGTTETGILSFTTATPPQPPGSTTTTPAFPLLTVPPNIFPTETPNTPAVAHTLTTKQKLALALKNCRKKHNHHQRSACEKQAHKRYKR